MTEAEVVALFRRIDTCFPPYRKLDEKQAEDKLAEWARALAKFSADTVNDAFDDWADTKSAAPKIADIKQICLDKIERRNMRLPDWTPKYQNTGCPICGGKRGAVLVNLPGDPYGFIALKNCPCGVPGQLEALKNGQKITIDTVRRSPNGNIRIKAKLAVRLITMCTENGRIEYARLDGEYVERYKVTAKENAPEKYQQPDTQMSLFTAVTAEDNDLAAELDLPPF